MQQCACVWKIDEPVKETYAAHSINKTVKQSQNNTGPSVNRHQGLDSVAPESRETESLTVKETLETTDFIFDTFS